MPRRSYHQPALDKYALELGYVSIYWAKVERGLDRLIETLTPLPRGHVAEAITGNADLRSKLQMIRALAFVRRPADGFFEYVLGLLDYIDNDIRPRRNDHIHGGVFRSADGRTVRRLQRTKLRRPQSFQIELSTLEEVPARIRDMRQLCSDLQRVSWALMELDLSLSLDEMEARIDVISGIPLPPSHPTHVEQYLRQAKPFRRRKRAGSTRARPPGSSRA